MRTESMDDASSIDVEVRDRPPTVTRVAAVLWVAGWLATEASAVLHVIRYGWSIGAILLIAVWTGVGVFALVAIVWVAVGMPEHVTVSGRALQLHRGIGPFGRTRRFDGGAIRALRVFGAQPAIVANYAAVRAFWDRGAGRIAFDVDGRTFAFAPSLDDGTIDEVCSIILEYLPGAAVQPSEAEPDTPGSRRRRLGWAAHLTSWFIAGGLLFPARTVITDLPICTAGALGGEYQPIDRSQLDADGRLVLAPLGDFSTETAQRIAQHFRSKYGLDIVVGPSIPLPEESFDVNRGQADSEMLLSILERSYPPTTTRTIVIGLTNADIFTPHLNWAFSYRRPPRFAVVSPARMDRGCLGIRPADDGTQMARLRKMVGKNIGSLFYGLPLSTHPRSMMNASIGGPQELDTMREEF